MNNKPINFDAAKIIEPNDQIRAENCLNKIKKVLTQHDCAMIPVVKIMGSMIKSEVVIQAIPRKHPLGIN